MVEAPRGELCNLPRGERDKCEAVVETWVTCDDLALRLCGKVSEVHIVLVMKASHNQLTPRLACRGPRPHRGPWAGRLS